MARVLARLGRWAARRRVTVLVVWLVALLGLGGGALGFSGTLSDAISIPGTPAQQAMDQLAEKIPAAAGAQGTIVFQADEGRTVLEPTKQRLMAEAIAEIRELPSVTTVIDPLAARAISLDGSVAMGQVIFAGQLTEVPDITIDTIANIADRITNEGLTMLQGGAAVKQMPAIGSTEGLGAVVALIVLLITFGSIVAAGLPLLTALIGLGVGMGGILIVSGFIEMTSTAPILALMLGLAVGIDYALFIVHRHRRQLIEGMPVEESIGRAIGTAGSAVVFAGMTVVIALAALAVVGIPFLAVMGFAAAATVVMAVLVAMTLVPALLGFAGEKILPRKLRRGVKVGRHAAEYLEPVVEDTQAAVGAPGRWAKLVTRRPVAVIVAVAVIFSVLAIPAFSLHLGLPDDGAAATDTPQRQAYDAVSQAFGPGANGPLIVTVSPDSPIELQETMGAVVGAVSQLDGVMMAMPAGASDDGQMGMLQVVPQTGPGDVATENLVHDLRDLAIELGPTLHAELAVTGLTAMMIDVSEKLNDAMPIYLAIVVGLALILLLIVFRSLLVPLKAAIGFLLSVAVSFGAVVAVYQWGWLGWLFGVHTPAPIVSFLPIILIGVLFGLAMDYEVFMVSGMREAWAHRDTNGNGATEAVREGFSVAGRVVTAAAIIMISVFGGFVFAPDLIIASMGFALALGVLVDAFVVRMTLVPAVMTLLGAHAWYLPKWLDKILPNVDIEGASLDDPTEKVAVAG